MLLADRLKDLMLVFFTSCFTPTGWRPQFEQVLRDIDKQTKTVQEQKEIIWQQKRRIEELEKIINALPHPKKEITEIKFERLRPNA